MIIPIIFPLFAVDTPPPIGAGGGSGAIGPGGGATGVIPGVSGVG